ncbi:hypothetical protein BS78_07G125800 [Paspalum vaginatum]|nr:hypothetical protein BS78_07G125800 [Paspalum vaginatum]
MDTTLRLWPFASLSWTTPLFNRGAPGRRQLRLSLHYPIMLGGQGMFPFSTVCSKSKMKCHDFLLEGPYQMPWQEELGWKTAIYCSVVSSNQRHIRSDPDAAVNK